MKLSAAQRYVLDVMMPKLTPQDCNDIVFALKGFHYEKYQSLRYDAPKVQLAHVNRDDVIAALRLWGPASLADRLDKSRAQG